MATVEHDPRLELRNDEIRDELNTIDRENRGQPFDEATRDRWNVLNNELDANKATLVEQRKRDERLREIVDRGDPGYFESGDGAGGRRDGGVTVSTAHRSAGLRAIDRHRDVLDAESGDRLDNHVRNRDPLGLDARYLDAVGDDAYYSAWLKMLRDPHTGHLRFTPQEVDAVQRVSRVESERAIAVGAGPTGGFAIPFVLDPTIIISGQGVLNPLRQVSRQETVAVGEYHAVTADQATVAYSAEATEVADNSPTLVGPAIIARRVVGFVPVSIEAMQDWGGLPDQMFHYLADAKAVVDAQMFLTGLAASNQPTGILSIGQTNALTTTQRVQTAVSATFAVGDSWLLKAGLAPRFIANSSVVAHQSIFDKVYRFVGGNSVEPPIMPTRDGECFGKPAFDMSTMVSTTTTGSKIMLAGDFRSGHLITDVVGTTAELIPHLFGPTNRFPTGQRGIFAMWRTGAGVIVPNAFRYLEVL